VNNVPPVVVQLVPPAKTSGYAFIRGDKANTLRQFRAIIYLRHM
jgi:hypothetical protein